jgi:cell division protein FtsQ
MSKAKTPSNRRRNAPRFTARNAFSSIKGLWHWDVRRTREAIARRLARRLPALRKAGGFITALIVLAGMIALGRLTVRYARTSPAFATTAIEVKGLSKLTRDEVIGQTGVAIGRNVFDVSEREAEAKLREHPWIASAIVKRRLPGRYTIEVRERRAVALVAMGDVLLVAADGTVFKRLGAGDPYDLPMITGLDHEPFTADRSLRASALLNAVALLGEYAEAGLSRKEPVAEVHIEADQSVSLYIGKDATNVRLGNRPYRVKLQRLRQVLETLQKKRSRAAYVYLDNSQRSDRVTVRPR